MRPALSRLSWTAPAPAVMTSASAAPVHCGPSIFKRAGSPTLIVLTRVLIVPIGAMESGSGSVSDVMLSGVLLVVVAWAPLTTKLMGMGVAWVA